MFTLGVDKYKFCGTIFWVIPLLDQITLNFTKYSIWLYRCFTPYNNQLTYLMHRVLFIGPLFVYCYLIFMLSPGPYETHGDQYDAHNHERG